MVPESSSQIATIHLPKAAEGFAARPARGLEQTTRFSPTHLLNNFHDHCTGPFSPHPLSQSDDQPCVGYSSQPLKFRRRTSCTSPRSATSPRPALSGHRRSNDERFGPILEPTSQSSQRRLIITKSHPMQISPTHLLNGSHIPSRTQPTGRIAFSNLSYISP
jgi:hypothetical protein